MDEDDVTAIIAERDRLRDALDAGLAQWVKEANHAARRIGECNRERDRLRAVVEATRTFIAAQVDADSTPEEDLAAWNATIDAFHQLDGSTDMGGDHGRGR
jgi:hypothetical protein